jgi:2-C-methyl-D-erythritol 4-phosphate cytidylyltransferase
MSRTPARITQADVARVIRAAKQCGAGAVVINVADRTIRVVIPQESTVQAGADLEADVKVVL